MKYIIEENRIYANDENGKVIAEILFEHSEGAYNITRTFVDESLRGQGVGNELMEMVLEEIRKRNKEVTASCSYAAHWLEKREQNEKQ